MSWSVFVDNTMETATCVTAAVGGSVSQRLADVVIAKTDLKKYAGPTFGGLGLEFLIRAATNAAVLQAMAYVRPEDTRSMLYEIVYYAADQRLLNSAVALGRYAVGIVEKALTPSIQAFGPTPSPVGTGVKGHTGAAMDKGDCACKH